MDAQEIAETIASGIRAFDPGAELDLSHRRWTGRNGGAVSRSIRGRPITPQCFVSGHEAMFDMTAASGLRQRRAFEVCRDLTKRQ
jgi:hypothetical protein